ncbi:MAG: YibE/F family protein [Eubacteriales bacterium]|nr:YibE/F family protein [Eubacteriales bacterium]
MNKDILKRLSRIVLPMVVLLGIIMGSSLVKVNHIKADTNIIYVRAKVVSVSKDNSEVEEFGGNQKVYATILNGRYKGESCELHNSNTYQRGAFCQAGTRIIAMVQMDSLGKLTGTVYNYDRTPMIYCLAVLFSVCLLTVGGRKGLASLYALVFTFICVICMYIPLLYVGMNGTLAAILTAVLISIISIYILNGWSKKTACAIVGTACGVMISGILAMIAGKMSHLSGYNMQDVESMVFIANSSRLKISDIIYAGILISSLGAVMDVGVSVVAAMKEIQDKSPGIKRRELFFSGMRVGHDMMGTMSNTLILAYTGSATGVLLTVYSFQMPFLQVMGYNSIIIEIVCGLCGTIGVILTVPIQALTAALVLK